MKIVEGNLTLLGNATIQNKLIKYSVIEIGDQVLQNTTVPNSLDNFLSRAFKQQGNTKLFLNGKVLCGVETPEGKLYCYKANFSAAIVLCVAGVALIPLLGLGLIFIAQGVAELKNHDITKKLKEMGATVVTL